MLSCKEVSRLVSESRETDLTTWQRIQVWMHLWMCDLCSRFEQQVDFLGDVARQFVAAGDVKGEPGTGLSPEARERIKKSLKSDSN